MLTTAKYRYNLHPTSVKRLTIKLVETVSNGF